MSTWPATLPQDLFLNTTDQDDESRVITPMDAGPATVRNRFSAVPRAIKTALVLTGAQLVTFNTFFRDTLEHGTSQFDWKDPVTDEAVSYRFKQKPAWTCVRPDPTPANRIWRGELSLEILP